MGFLSLPANQQRHDNVAVVKLKAGDCTFEIACYRNKAHSYRKGVEKDIEEVLQTERVFTNVGKGMFAKIEDVRKHLTAKIKKSKHMTDDELERAACKLILEKGDMQLNEMERKAEVEHMLHDVATTIAAKCIHPETRRPYPVSMVLSALDKIGYAPNNRRSAKLQALEAIRKLIDSNALQLERAPMYLRASVNASQLPVLLSFLYEQQGVRILKSETDMVDFLIPPDRFREVDSIIAKGGSDCSLQVIANVVTEDGEGHLSYEAAKPTSALSASESVVSGPPQQQQQKPTASTAAQKRGGGGGGGKDVKKGKGKGKGKGKNRNRGDDTESSDEDSGPLPLPSGKKKGKQAAADGGAKRGGLQDMAVPSSSDDEGKGRGKGKGKAKAKRRGKEKSNEAAAARTERRRKEKEEQDEEFGVSEAQKRKEELKQQKEEKQRLELLRDPNYYESDEFGSDYDDFYKDEKGDKTLEEIHEEKEALKKAEAEAARLKAEEEERQHVRTAATRKKRRRNKKGEFISDSEDSEASDAGPEK
eukprot:TRINITY_DN21125_c0_g1_i2.p1 TRINITY_DN21125_c0_g1~~TRINITY_DN21125_c0_g1_i2.p1  ORF type:complete len:550 (+),score=272.00 TRINITY_DN21125_c0_g1_i2:52-1650(+)